MLSNTYHLRQGCGTSALRQKCAHADVSDTDGREADGAGLVTEEARGGLPEQESLLQEAAEPALMCSEPGALFSEVGPQALIRERAAAWPVTRSHGEALLCRGSACVVPWWTGGASVCLVSGAVAVCRRGTSLPLKQMNGLAVLRPERKPT